MDFKQFEYVLVICEEKSISRAAKRLYISQPSLSQYIGRIESELGTAIFDRSTSPLSLTYEGTIYVDTARKILELANEMKKTFADIESFKTGRLNIGLTASKANFPLPIILPVFKEKYPGIELRLTEASSTELEELLLRGLIDVCMMNLPITSLNIAYESIREENIFLAAPPDYEAFGCSLEISALNNKSFILLHSNQRIRQIANKFFENNMIKPKILLETRSIETALRLSGAGMGFTFVPESCANSSAFVKAPKYFDIGLTWTFVIAYKKGSYMTKAAKAFAEVAKDVLAGS